jgi:hypothetical protein
MSGAKNEWVKRRWALLIERYGGRCSSCGAAYDLEFAHLQPTQCRGEGRGKYRRLRDILQNAGLYRLLCMNCHDEMDGRTRRKRQVEIRGKL